jgi:hypothetical protein
MTDEQRAHRPVGGRALPQPPLSRAPRIRSGGAAIRPNAITRGEPSARAIIAEANMPEVAEVVNV